MGFLLIRSVYAFARLLVFLLFMEAIMSWFVKDLNSPVGRVYNVIRRLNEPIVIPCRNFLSRYNTGMFDWSIFMAMILVEIVAKLLTLIITAIF